LKWRAMRAGLVGLMAQLVMGVPPTAGDQQPPLMAREREVALALSACPPPVASKAAVYVLEKAGYVKVRDSQNGFTAIVQHSLPNSQEPRCMDAEGKRTHLPRVLKVAELRGWRCRSAQPAADGLPAAAATTAVLR
jgi:hypothetical protein